MIKMNGVPIKITTFPNGESLINAVNIATNGTKENLVTMNFESDKDLIHLMMIKEYLDQNFTGLKTTLSMPYIPYSRMDRTEGQTLFTLKYIVKFINGLNFSKVCVHEPHSDVSVALLDRCVVENTSAELAKGAMILLGFYNHRFSKTECNDYILFPDGGAEKRYSKQITYPRTLTASKVRDFATGNIKSLDIIGEVPTEPFRVMIIDDLCSKGGTFMLSALKLKELGATDIYLTVTHCENTIYEGDILKTDLIKRVFTTDSILTNFTSDKIEVLNV